MHKLHTVRLIVSAAIATSLMVLTPLSARATDDPWFSNVTTTNATFYPRVQDDYKDYTKIRWATSDTNFQECWASLYDSDGNLLIDENTGTSWRTQFDYTCGSGSGNVLWWNGMNKDGKVVPTGNYRITVRYYDENDQVIHQLSRHVTVATGTKWFRERYSYGGASFDRKSTSGNCRAYRSSGDAVLDCWGGNYARVNYSRYVNYDLRVKDFTWCATGDPGCCSRGVIRKSATRDGHDLHIYVKVTKWRSYEVYRVGFSYLAKNRI